ncbi:RNA-binding protein [Candidatus Woesearchaeota archaeon]|jgi:Zn-ribbon RNA-binding protein|nr:RNA-binding protein [Candidatus Woesearchaeota archaeon]
MEEKQVKCNSCNKSITNDGGSVRFKCPSCSKYELVRCKACRVNIVRYKCAECGFEGPN